MAGKPVVPEGIGEITLPVFGNINFTKLNNIVANYTESDSCAAIARDIALAHMLGIITVNVYGN